MEFFTLNQYPTSKEIEELANEANISKKEVIFWFQNRRHRRGISKTNRFQDHQNNLLMDFFQKNKFPSAYEIQNLSKNLELTNEQISNWFKRKRLNKNFKK